MAWETQEILSPSFGIKVKFIIWITGSLALLRMRLVVLIGGIDIKRRYADVKITVNLNKTPGEVDCDFEERRLQFYIWDV